MPRGKKHGPEEVIPKLREAEVLISQGEYARVSCEADWCYSRGQVKDSRPAPRLASPGR